MDDDVAMAGTRPGVPARSLSVGCSTAIIMRRAAKVQQSKKQLAGSVCPARAEIVDRLAPLYGIHSIAEGMIPTPTPQPSSLI